MTERVEALLAQVAQLSEAERDELAQEVCARGSWRILLDALKRQLSGPGSESVRADRAHELADMMARLLGDDT